MQAISLINNQMVDCGDLETTILYLKELVGNQACRGVKFTYREANRLAHTIAKFTNFHGEKVGWRGDLPFEAWPILLADKQSPCSS